jgi:hypothetical protein
MNRIVPCVIATWASRPVPTPMIPSSAALPVVVVGERLLVLRLAQRQRVEQERPSARLPEGQREYSGVSLLHLRRHHLLRLPALWIPHLKVHDC